MKIQKVNELRLKLIKLSDNNVMTPADEDLVDWLLKLTDWMADVVNKFEKSEAKQ